jgi:integrase
METVTDKRGRTYQRRRRPLSNTSINAMITLLGQILQQAVDYELIDRNPVRVGGRSARFLKRVRPKRTFLEVDEFHALLHAAGELEAEARQDYKGLGRRAMVATLDLAGFRIGEMMDLRVAQVDLRRGRFKLADAKTEAGVREVEISLYLRDELLEHATPWTVVHADCDLGPPITSSARRPAGAAIRTDSVIASSRARLSARTRTGRRAGCRHCPRSRRIR